MHKLVPDEVLLGLLKSKPSHGYELLDRFKSKTDLGRIWTMSTSQLYAVLKRLEREGLILGQQFHSKDAPSRIEYSITPTGEKRLQNWLYETKPSTSIHKIRVLFTSRLYIANLIEMPIEEIISYQKIVCLAKHKEFLMERSQVNNHLEGLILDYIIGQLDSALDWLEKCSLSLLTQSNKA